MQSVPLHGPDGIISVRPVLESLHISGAKVDSEPDSRHSLHIREILISLGSAVRHLITEKQFLDLV